VAKCEICEKKINVAKKHAYRSSRVTKRSLRKQYPNVQRVRVFVGGASKKMYVCTKCLKSQKVQRAAC
jgi:large subunit ribosomal protein L28